MTTQPMRIASAPCSYGVDEVMIDDIWMPGPDEMLDWMLGTGYLGTELGPPGFLGAGAVARERLESRGLELVGAFLPQHFSRADKARRGPRVAARAGDAAQGSHAVRAISRSRCCARRSMSPSACAGPAARRTIRRPSWTRPASGR